jgi:pilus assembly protein CpaB
VVRAPPRPRVQQVRAPAPAPAPRRDCISVLNGLNASQECF